MNLHAIFPRASKSFIALNAQLSRAIPQSDQAPALGSAIPGKVQSVPRVTVRFIGYRCRPLDPDNFAGGCKDLLDGLRHAALILGDEPWRINFETRQEKVRSRCEEKTVIEIEYETIPGAKTGPRAVIAGGAFVDAPTPLLPTRVLPQAL
jgi:hypothetical protein